MPENVTFNQARLVGCTWCLRFLKFEDNDATSLFDHLPIYILSLCHVKSKSIPEGQNKESTLSQFRDSDPRPL